jgi:hypothetical protein
MSLSFNNLPYRFILSEYFVYKKINLAKNHLIFIGVSCKSIKGEQNVFNDTIFERTIRTFDDAKHNTKFTIADI